MQTLTANQKRGYNSCIFKFIIYMSAEALEKTETEKRKKNNLNFVLN